MWNLQFLLLTFNSLVSSYNFTIDQTEEIINVYDCAVRLIGTMKGADITLIYKDLGDFASEIYKLENNKIINRNVVNYDNQLAMYNDVYVIITESYEELFKEVKVIKEDSFWNPKAQIIVVVGKEVYENIFRIFEVFADSYAFNIIIIARTEGLPSIFTRKTISRSFCKNASNTIVTFDCDNIADYKYIYDSTSMLDSSKDITEFECSTKIILNGIFPLTFLKTKTEGNEFERSGYEDVFFTLGAEYLNVDYRKNYENERVGNVYENLTATGLLGQIKFGKIDGITGGMLLLEQRAKVFDYVYTRFADFYVVIIPKSLIIEKWKSIFLTFKTIVWCIIIFMFIGFSVLCHILNIFNPQDKIRTFLILFGYYFGFISKYNDSIFICRMLIVIWCLGSWLLVCYFQSMLSSVFTSPGYYHQIQTLDEVIDLHFDLYINDVYRNFISDSLEINFTKSFRHLIYCESMLDCLRNVSLGGKRATITSYLYFQYHEELFHDQMGESTLYYLPRPFNQMWLTTYLRKGHPKLSELRLLEMRIIEGGFLTKSFNDVNPLPIDSANVRFSTIKRSDLAGIYYILMSGWLLTFFIFLLELCMF